MLIGCPSYTAGIVAGEIHAKREHHSPICPSCGLVLDHVHYAGCPKMISAAEVMAMLTPPEAQHEDLIVVGDDR